MKRLYISYRHGVQVFVYDDLTGHLNTVKVWPFRAHRVITHSPGSMSLSLRKYDTVMDWIADPKNIEFWGIKIIKRCAAKRLLKAAGHEVKDV